MTYEAMTEIITSRSGKEQRVAQRDVPRIMIDYKTMVSENDMRSAMARLADQQDDTMQMPDWPRPISLDGPAAAGSSLVVADTLDGWVRSTVAIIFVWQTEDGVAYTTSTISGISGYNISLSTPLARAVPAEALAYRMWTGHLEKSVAGSFAGDRISEVTVKFSVDPGFENLGSIPANPETYGDRELISREPDWNQPMDAEFLSSLETLDYGVGRKAFTRPVAFNDRLLKCSYWAEDRADVDYFLGIFRRLYGQQGEVFMPTFTEDLAMRGPLDSSDTAIRVIGSDTATMYAASTIFDHIAIFLMDGTVIRRTVPSITPISDSTGNDSILNLGSSVGQDVDLSDIDRICWLPVWRFASDQLVIQWQSDESAMIGVSFKTLESLSPET